MAISSLDSFVREKRFVCLRETVKLIEDSGWNRVPLLEDPTLSDQ